MQCSKACLPEDSRQRVARAVACQMCYHATDRTVLDSTLPVDPFEGIECEEANLPRGKITRQPFSPAPRVRCTVDLAVLDERDITATSIVSRLEPLPGDPINLLSSRRNSPRTSGSVSTWTTGSVFTASGMPHLTLSSRPMFLQVLPRGDVCLLVQGGFSHGIWVIIITGTKEHDHSREPVNSAMYDYFPANELVMTANVP